MCLTAKRRKRCREWFFSELTPVLEPDGRLIVVGTRKHHDDLYATLMDNRGYDCRIQKAVIDEANRTVLCPEKWTYERLMEDKQELGSVLWSREKQNEVVDDATALFKIEWLEAAQDETLRMGEPEPDMAIYQGVDLAIVADKRAAEERDSDYTVIVTIGVRPDGTRVVIDCFRERGLSPQQVMEAVLREAGRYRPTLITLENNLFQRIYELELIRNSDLPLKGHTTTRVKADLYQGVPSLAVLFENGKVRLPAGDEYSRSKSRAIIQEFYGLGVEAHDDLVMAFWLGNLNIPMHMRPPQTRGGEILFGWKKA
jgi:phage terminase large subunit-like protein